jgi:ketosteroid isomerase-like protein
MHDVVLGRGKLAGKGVYAARDFEQGELVVPYRLEELTQAEFNALPEGEWEWTHSFHGKIYLFPEPERYVNHDDDPSTLPDHGRGGDVALRPIRKGEAITIDDRLELRYELETFMQAYERASNGRDFDDLSSLIADGATHWSAQGTFEGKSEIRRFFEQTRAGSGGEEYAVSDVEWVAATYWVAACTYRLGTHAIADGGRETSPGRATTILRRIDGSWRVVHEHSTASA